MENKIGLAKNKFSQTDRKISDNAAAKYLGKTVVPGILFITSYTPRQCGIATYSHDLITAINNKFSNAFNISIAALESKNEKHEYNETVKHILDTDNQYSYRELAKKINNNQSLQLILIQHEFGLFRNNEADFLRLLENIL